MNYSVFDNLLDGILITTTGGDVVYTNDAITSITSLKSRYFKNKNILKILGTIPVLEEYFEKALVNNQKSSAYTEIKFSHPELGSKCLQISCQIQNDILIFYIHDVSLEELLHSKYRSQLEQKEELIGKLNRKVFELEFLINNNPQTLMTTSDLTMESLLEKVCSQLSCDFAFVIEDNALLEEGYQGHYSSTFSYFQSQINRNSQELIANTLFAWQKEFKTLRSTTSKDHHLIIDSRFSVFFYPVWQDKTLKSLFCFGYHNNLSDSLKLNFPLLVAFSQQAALFMENKFLFLQTITDPKTDLYNTRFLNHKIESEIERSIRYGHTFSVIVFDIDFFKKINDTYGHLAGDHVLIEVAKILKDTFRKTDFVSRFGGEEFVVLCIETNKNNLFALAERVREKIEKATFQFEGHNIPVTISGGISSFPECGTTREALLAMADEALYEAKRTGRNKNVVFEPQPQALGPLKKSS